jgi:rSAM/selenodomain-associated transferase 1
MSRTAVIVMVKAPRPGNVKTRLLSALTAEHAASLASCFAQDAVANGLRASADVIVAYTPSCGRAILEPLLPRGLLWIEQRGADLGERLESIFRDAARIGFDPLIITGADSPTLPTAFITTACEALASMEADVTLGPTIDGGYYLVGLSAQCRHLFRDVAWSTPLAYAQTAANALSQGLRLLELPQWYDVDTPEDLLRLREEIFTDEEARLRARATHGWLLAYEQLLPHS